MFVTVCIGCISIIIKVYKQKAGGQGVMSRSRLEHINREINRATRSYDFCDKQAYVYCDAAAAYAKAKTDFVELHVEACNHRGTVRQRRKFSLAYDKMVERMRLMHKELIRTNDHNQGVIRETEEGYGSSFAELEREFDFPKFVALFEEYAAWCDADVKDADVKDADVKDADVKDADINVGAAISAIKQYTSRMEGVGYIVTPMWIAPHMFEMYVNGVKLKTKPLSVKLKTHAAFQAMINAKVPNATVAWRGGETELRLWDSGYVFYGNAPAAAATAICSLSFDASRQVFALDAGTTTLLFRKVPAYAPRGLTWRELADGVRFHHALLSQIVDRSLDHAIDNCGALSRLMSKTQAAKIPQDRLDMLMRAFNVCRRSTMQQ